MAIIFAVFLALLLVVGLLAIAWTIYYSWQNAKNKPSRPIPKEKYPLIGCGLAAIGFLVVAMVAVCIAGIVLLLSLHKVFGT